MPVCLIVCLEQIEHFNGARYLSSLDKLEGNPIWEGEEARSRLGPRDKEVDLEGERRAMDEREMVGLFKIGGRRQKTEPMEEWINHHCPGGIHGSGQVHGDVRLPWCRD